MSLILRISDSDFSVFGMKFLWPIKCPSKNLNFESLSSIALQSTPDKTVRSFVDRNAQSVSFLRVSQRNPILGWVFIGPKFSS